MHCLLLERQKGSVKRASKTEKREKKYNHRLE